MDFADYLATLRKGWRTIVVATIVGVLLAGITTLLIPRTYSADARTFVSVSGDANTVGNVLNGAQFTLDRVQSYTQLVQSPRVLGPVSLSLGYRVKPTQVSASNPLNTVLIDVQAQSSSKSQSVQIANAVALQLGRVIVDLETPLGGGVSPVKVSLVQPASVTSVAHSPKLSVNLVLGFLLGLAVGVGTVLLRDVLDTSIKSLEQAQVAANANLIGAIGFDPDAKIRPLVALDQRSARSEAFRTIRTNLEFIDVDNPPKAIVVTSSLPVEGKSTTAVNLAITLSQAGKKVCLIEADLRKPRVADYLGVDGAVGLTSVLSGQQGLEEALVSWNRGMLTVLPSGPIPPNPSELLGSEHMERLLTQLRESFDYVVVDATPLLPVTDAAVVARIADGALMVIRYGKTTREQAARASDLLAAAGARLLGTVLNFVPPSGRAGSGYGYGYGYGNEHGYGYGGPGQTPNRPDLDVPTEESLPPLPTAQRGSN